MGRLFSSNRNVRIMVAAVFALWLVCLSGLVLGALLYTRNTRAKGVATQAANPITEARIEVQPGEGYSGTEVKVLGANWRPGDVVFVRLQDPAGGADENYAYAGAVADDTGSFTTSFTYPYETRWLESNSIQVLARAEASGVQALGEFRLAKPTVVATPTQLVTATPTDTPEPPVPTVGPGMPTPTRRPRPTLPPPPPAPVITDWKGVYFSNPNLQGQAVMIRNDQQISFDWGMAGPAAGLPTDNYSVQWTRNLGFEGGNYRFIVRADDGVRLFVDDQPIIDQWHDSGPTTYVTEMYLSGGNHSLRLDYFERIGWSLAQLSWERLQENYPDWKAEYFVGPEVSGNPAAIRNDAWVDFNWGGGQPVANVPADNFAARWSRRMHFDESNYRFSLKVDDGARLWVDGNLIIDQWHDSGPTTYVADRGLSGGDHDLRLDYYDRGGSAEVHLWWEKSESSASYPDWKAEYFSNKDLDGDPERVRNDRDVDFDWGSDSPTDGLPRNDFSVRWTRKLRFDSTATYRFDVRVDGGIRVWVDDDLIIDAWEDGSLRTETGTKRISKGDHRVTVEYFDDQGDAVVEMSWERQSTAATATVTKTAAPPPTNTPGPAPTSTPVPQPTSVPVVTDTPAPIETPAQPALILAPSEGPVNTNVTVLGTNWPVGQKVNLTLAKPQISSQSVTIDPAAAAGVAIASQDGEFKTTIAIPAGAGWESETQAMIVAFTSDFSKTAVAPFSILPSADQPTEEATNEPIVVPTVEEPVEPTATQAPAEQPTDTPVPVEEATEEPTPTEQAADAPTEQPTEPVAEQPTDTPVPAEPPATEVPPEKPTEETIPVEPPAGPIMSIMPISGTLNITLTVQGAGWPAGSQVGFSMMTAALPEAVVPLSGTAQIDEQGGFAAQVFLPATPGWELVPSAVVVATSVDQTIQVTASFSVTTLAQSEPPAPEAAPPQE